NIGLDDVGAPRAAHVDVGHDADDRHPWPVLAAEADAASDRIFVRPEPLRHRFVDDDGRLRFAILEEAAALQGDFHRREVVGADDAVPADEGDRKSTRLNSSHLVMSYAVFCLKKKKSSQ